MPTRVHFRFNKLTGEVEEFLVDDLDRHLPEAEHDRRALAVGAALARRPGVAEVIPGPAPVPEAIPPQPETPVTEVPVVPAAPVEEGS